MKRSEFINLIMSYEPDEDIEIVFIGDGEGGIEVDGFGYHEVYLSDIEPAIASNGKIVGVALNIH